jgi:type IV pilus assembly protein PilE
MKGFGRTIFGRSAQRGFTLIELMVVVVIIAILAAIAYPAYTKQVRKGRRSDAFNSISDYQLREERWRADHSTYGTLVNLGISTTSPSAYYTLSQPAYAGNCTTTGTPAADNTNSYAVTATATGIQAQDTICATITLQSYCGVITKTSTGGGTCWPQ